MNELERSRTEVRAAKAAARSRALRARASLSVPLRQAASDSIRRRLLTLAELRGVRAVLGYAAFGSEVDLDPYLDVLLSREIGVFLPWVEGSDLRISRIRDLRADVAPGWRGLREPRLSGRTAAHAGRLGAAIVPGVSFDLRGTRLGYGGGHFDRLLTRLSPETIVVGVAFDVQVVDALPTEPHDRPVDVVVTESRVLRPARP